MHRSNQQASTATRYLQSLCQLLTSAEVPLAGLLAGTDIQPRLLEAPDGVVSHDSLDRLLQNVERLTDERFPGILLGHHLNISAHGAAGYAGLTAPNAGAAIGVAVRFFPLITELATLKLDVTEKRVRLTIIPAPGISGRTERFVVHTLLASFDVMGSFLVGNLELRAGLTFPNQAGLKARLGSTLQGIAFNQPSHSLSLPRERLEAPFALADRTAHAQAVAQCEEALNRLEGQRTLAGRVVGLLTRIGPPYPDQENVAAQLGMSTRTLHRHLLEDGVRYRTLILEARMNSARRYLLDERLGVTETAYRLGYRDSANFTRAFRQATGVTPTGFVKAGSSNARPAVPAHPRETDQPAPSSSPRNT
ncbi:AraC family transcriptional regulator [Marinobacter sp. F4206]|uniref:AraC family transcriptional regulator n=1 Tax=Marinobacter sp. F4206 TaxID=2861777 RepID=UPI001C605C71|nr:AraC family transcriptional regulator [Marinobacter sp. F4206]MBW4934080.1 AraC family transcriptional regulator [Marinobacter sp. F4206]